MTGVRYDITFLIDSWEPPKTPHCSNCLHCKVNGDPADPYVQCAVGHVSVVSGTVLPLAHLLRRKRARQFVPPERCPDYADMGPASAPRHAEALP